MSDSTRRGMRVQCDLYVCTVMALTLAVLCAASSVHADTVVYTEPFTGADGAQPTDFSTFTNTSGMVSQLDGAGEYEQARVNSDPGAHTALGFYDNTDVTDLGAWWDVTADVLLRYSGGSANRNGVLIRARDVAGTSSGDYYHARVEGESLILYRVVNGSFTSIASTNTGASLGAIHDRLLRVQVANVPNPGSDHVNLQVNLYDGTTDAAAVIRTINFTDTSSNAVTRAGGVGLRTYFDGGSSGLRATFDDLTVTNNRPNLLWYDDYPDSSAIRNEFLTDGVITPELTGGKLQFDDIGDGARGLALIDYDDETSTTPWANVKATTMMRLNTNGTNNGQISAGLVLRESGTTGANNGTGDFYHYRLVHGEDNNTYAAQLYRVNDGSFTLLDNVTLSMADVPESENIFLSFLAINEAGNVHLVAKASLDQMFNEVFGEIDIIDTSANRILGPGAAGFRTFGGGGLSDGVVNFDNFTVISIPAPMALPGTLALMALAAVRRRV